MSPLTLLTSAWSTSLTALTIAVAAIFVLGTNTPSLGADNATRFPALSDADYSTLEKDLGPDQAMATFWWLCRGLYMTRVSDGFQLPLERDNVFQDFYRKPPEAGPAIGGKSPWQ